MTPPTHHRYRSVWIGAKVKQVYDHQTKSVSDLTGGVMPPPYDWLFRRKEWDNGIPPGIFG